MERYKEYMMVNDLHEELSNETFQVETVYNNEANVRVTLDDLASSQVVGKPTKSTVSEATTVDKQSKSVGMNTELSGKDFSKMA